MATHNPKFDEKVKFVIKDTALVYPKLFEDHMDDYEGTLSYKVTCTISKELGEKMAESGFNVKVSEDDEYFVDAKRKYKLKDGTIMPPPEIVFKDGTRFDKAVHGMIGNGTIADVHVTAQYIKVGKVTHLPARIFKVVIKNLVPYESDAGESADDVF